jgi:anti-sigma factor RsiW
MNHQPFEEWLLNEKLISPKQKLELDAHLRMCSYCSALAETGKALQTVKKVSPAAGFSARFQARLAMQKAAERRRKRWGAVLFTFGGLVMMMWLIGPYLASFFAAPATWIAAVIQWGIFLITTAQAVAQAGSVLLRMLPGFLSPFAFMVLLSAFAGIGLLWSVSIWRFVRVPRGV